MTLVSPFTNEISRMSGSVGSTNRLPRFQSGRNGPETDRTLFQNLFDGAGALAALDDAAEAVVDLRR
jgi:hypothetical protein